MALRRGAATASAACGVAAFELALMAPLQIAVAVTGGLGEPAKTY
jgi:hypothetical protein